jgi:aerobic-type carbon monoxide dehydrogenase small subunit (CoxS/CutS family)
MRLTVNGAVRNIDGDTGRSLLTVLRDDLDLTGAKYGCGEGQCGACVVLLDGEPVPACVTPVGAATGRQIETVEGLAPQAFGVLRRAIDGPGGGQGAQSAGGRAPASAPQGPRPPVSTPALALHPVQRAFMEETALQCGYCTPGMIMGTVALLRKNPHPEPGEIVRALDGHLCRCGVYPRIVRAVLRAADLLEATRLEAEAAGAVPEAGATQR